MTDSKEIDKSAKKARSMTLSYKLNHDLETLCEHLGVNVHSYMVNEVAKSVQRDLLSLTSKKEIESMVTQMLRLAEDK